MLKKEKSIHRWFSKRGEEGEHSRLVHMTIDATAIASNFSGNMWNKTEPLCHFPTINRTDGIVW